MARGTGGRGSRTGGDRRQGDLFSDFYPLPACREPSPGTLDLGDTMAETLSAAIKSAPASRAAIASRMAELTGTRISTHMLDAWTSTAHHRHRFPAAWLPAFELATGSRDCLSVLADARGAIVLYGAEAIDAQLGQIRRARRELYQREQLLLTIGARP